MLQVRMFIHFLFWCLTSLNVHALGFYLPGIAPVNYCEPDSETASCKSQIKVLVNRLNSDESVIPYEYSHFDFCQEENNTRGPTENLGQVVFGQRIRPSPYKVTFLENKKCNILCHRKTYNPTNKKSMAALETLRQGIKQFYKHHWIVDNMPVTWCFPTQETNRSYCMPGFPMGCYVDKTLQTKDVCIVDPAKYEKDSYYLTNHVDLIIQYHSGLLEDWGRAFEDNGGRIVAVKVIPRSIDHDPENFDCSTDRPPLKLPESLKLPMEVFYTYSVTFQENHEIKWSSRWDYILESTAETQIQWFSIINSLVMVFFLSGMVAMIMLRTLHKDISRYNQLDLGDDSSEEFGWKLLHGDIFRPPRAGMLLSVFVGSGVQIFLMCLATLVLACFGFLSPANRGSLMTCAMVLFILMGTPAGYFSSRFYYAFGGERWKFNSFLTAVICPGFIFFIFFVLNDILWAEGSSGAVPFSTLVALLALWFGVSLPLTFIGTCFGVRKAPIEFPVATNQIPRQIPPQRIFVRLLPCLAMGGILPFACIYIQLFFIFGSLWAHQVYYMFGFLFLVFLILVITCSECAVLFCYFHLCAENYKWWWRSFLTGGFTAFYLFLYCIYFFSSKLQIEGTASACLYFGYCIIICFGLFLLTGTIGFMACYKFVRKIYSVIKVD